MAELVQHVLKSNSQSEISQVKDVKISASADLKERANEINPELARLKEKNRHEEDMIKYGRFGLIFGAEENSSKALTFTLTLIILLIWAVIIIISIWSVDLIDRATNFFKTIIPIITLAFGYFFGKK